MSKEENGYLFFDESTDFNGEIEAKRVVLAGKVNGVIHAERELHLEQGASIGGKIYTGNFSAADGSSCDGELHIGYYKYEGETGHNSNGTAGNQKNSIFLKIASLFSMA